MAISQALCTSYKQEILVGTHNHTTSTGDTFKISLYTSAATLSATTTAYTSSSEVTGTGYTAGGASLVNVTPTTSGTTAYLDWDDAVWSTATFTARGALIYNSSKSNKAVCVLDFGADKVVSAGTFTLQFPTADATNAIIRIA
jgi:hypothetical protein